LFGLGSVVHNIAPLPDGRGSD